MKTLLRSRKVQIALADAFFALVALTATRFVVPETADYILQVLAIVQVPVSVVIGGIAHEDAAALGAGTHPSQQADGG